MQTELRGTKFILATMIIQVIINIVILLFVDIQLALFMLLDTGLIIVAYIGFTKGKRGWAIFAIIYGMISLISSLIQGNLLNVGILLIIGGILGLKDS